MRLVSGSFDLSAVAAMVSRTDESARSAAIGRFDELAVPAGGLGRLAELGGWLSGAHGACPPRTLESVRVVAFAGDHGVASSGTSARDAGSTVELVRAVVRGQAALSVAADAVGASVRVADLALEAELAEGTAPAGVGRHKVRRSSGRIDVEDALTRDETLAALAAGVAIADEEVDAGADLLVTADLGVGATTAAAALVGVLTRNDASRVTGRGSGIDDDAWMRKCAAVRDAMRRARPVLGDPVALLATAGGADLAAVTGFLLQAAARRTPVVLDGVVSAASALVAHRVAFRSVDWWLAGHRSSEPAHALALERLSLSPVVDLGVTVSEGSGSLWVVPMLRAAQAALAHVPTRGDAAATGGG